MKKLWQTIKAEFITVLRNPFQIIFLLVLLPFALMQFMSFSFGTAFEPSTEPLDITLIIEDKAQNQWSESLVKTLESEAIADYFAIRGSQDVADFTLLIPENYQVSGGESPVEILVEANASSQKGEFIKNFIEQWQVAVSDQVALAEGLAGLDNVSQAEEVLAAVTNLHENLQAERYQISRWENRLNLSGQQYMSITGLGFILVMTMSSMVNIATQEKFGGLRKRLALLPLTAFEQVVYPTISNTLLAVVASALYYLLWKLTAPETFLGNPLFYLIYMLAAALLWLSLGKLIDILFPSWALQAFYQITNLAVMLLGVMPMERMLGEEIGKFFSQNTYREVFINPIISYHTGQGSGALLLHATYFVLIALAFLAIASWILSRRKGVAE